MYLLDDKRGDLRIAYSVGYPEETRRTLRMKVGQGIVGHRGRPGRSGARRRRDRRRALRRRGAGHTVRAGGAAAAEEARDRRPEPPELEAGPVHRARRGDPAAVRRARGGGARERAPVRSRAPVLGDARDAGGDRPGGRVDPGSRRAARAHRRPRAPADRLSDLRDPAAERAGGRARDEARHPIWRQAELAEGQARRRHRRLRRAAPGSGAGARRVGGSALHQGRRGLPIGAGDPACW